jgi:rhamnosyltransferase
MLCLKVFTTNQAAWRRYFGARNAVHCLNRYRSHWGLHWLGGLWAIQQALSIPLFDAQKLKKITVIVCGYLDGVFGWLGTFEHRQPHIAAFSKSARRRQIAFDGSSSVTVTGERL